jgi:hypothetical protein
MLKLITLSRPASTPPSCDTAEGTLIGFLAAGGREQSVREMIGRKTD